MFYVYIHIFTYICTHPHTLLVCVVSYCICYVVYHDAYQCDRCSKPFAKVSCHSCSVALAAHFGHTKSSALKSLSTSHAVCLGLRDRHQLHDTFRTAIHQPCNAFARSAELPCLKPWLGSPKLLSTKPKLQQPSGADTLQPES